MTAYATLESDLRDRWRPTPDQIEQAAEELADLPEGSEVFTAHLLVNKVHGGWTTDVKVVPVPGVYFTRASVWSALQPLVDAYAATTSQPVTGGYTRHWSNDLATEPGWAVWEDIAQANQ